jgi:hypothetical protein
MILVVSNSATFAREAWRVTERMSKSRASQCRDGGRGRRTARQVSSQRRRPQTSLQSNQGVLVETETVIPNHRPIQQTVKRGLALTPAVFQCQAGLGEA